MVARTKARNNARENGGPGGKRNAVGGHDQRDKQLYWCDVDWDVGGSWNQQEASATHDADFESELEDIVEWEGKLRGAIGH
jgi:hypothetical protein